MINFKQYINESNIDKIKEECRNINPNIDYSSSNWEKEFIDKTNWINISSNKKLSEEFIEYFKDYVYWYSISCFQNLSEKFIEKHINDVNWLRISFCRDLSEDFIEKYKNKVHWEYISKSQKLSEDFIKKHKDKINFEYLFYNRHISNEFIFDNINWFININIGKYVWRFEDRKFSDKWNKYKKLFGD